MDAREKTTIEKGLARMFSIALRSDDPQERGAAEQFSAAIKEASQNLRQGQSEACELDKKE